MCCIVRQHHFFGVGFFSQSLIDSMARTRRKKPGTGAATPAVGEGTDRFAGYEEEDDGGDKLVDTITAKDGPLYDALDDDVAPKKMQRTQKKQRSQKKEEREEKDDSPMRKPKKDMVDRAVNIEKKVKANKKEHKAESSAKATNMEVVSMSIPPGQKIGYQNHQASDQLIRVEKGKAKVITAGGTHTLKKGSVVIVPAGMEHSITNLSKTGDLKIFGIYSPPVHGIPAGGLGNLSSMGLSRPVPMKGAVGDVPPMGLSRPVPMEGTAGDVPPMGLSRPVPM